MPAQFAATIQALKRGSARSVKAAIRKIENWEEALGAVQVSGARAILRDLGALKRQLEQDKPDIGRVDMIVSRLAEAAEKVAAKLQGREAEKVRDLGGIMKEASAGGDAKGEQRLRQRPAPSRPSGKSSRKESEGRLSKSAGGARKMASRSGRSRYEEDEDDRRGPSGRVRDPEHDHRLRGQETDRMYEARHMERGYDGRGEVRDPEH
ncbi:MAG: hypothetical protein ACLQKK_05915, partial [Rhodomicrobium sp.]